MDKIVNFNEAKQAAQSIANASAAIASNQKNEFFELLTDIKDTPLTGEGFEEIGALLSLPEDKFSVLAPVFLTEFEKSMRNLDDATTLAQAMNAAGLKLEDLRESFDAMADSIDTEMKDILSEQKRDFLKEYWGVVYNCIAETEGIAKKVIRIPIELCREGAKIPVYAHLTDAGMDIYATEEITIKPGETKLIPTGLKVALPMGYELQVRPRSGMSLKTKLRVANAPGTIDAGYRDEIGVIIENVDPPIRSVRDNSDGSVDCLGNFEFGSSYTIGKGERFAQFVLSEVPKAVFYEVKDIGHADDRGGGFGSSGIK